MVDFGGLVRLDPTPSGDPRGDNGARAPQRHFCSGGDRALPVWLPGDWPTRIGLIR